MSKKSNLINENQTSRTNESKLFRLAFVGRLVEDKGIFDLLNAVKINQKCYAQHSRWR